MRRTQIYLTEEQRERISLLASDAGVSQAEVIRRILDEAFGLRSGRDERLEAVDATAGLLEDYPDWRTWLRSVRGSTADERLRRLAR